MTAIDMTPLFERILVAGGQGMLLAALVLGAQRLLGRWLTPAWRAALWVVVVARLLLPWTPSFSGSFYSLGNLAPAALGGLGAEPMVQVTYGAPTPARGASQAKPASVVQPPGASAAWSLAAWIWLAGVAGFWMKAAAGVVALRRSARATRPVSEPRLLAEFEAACQSLGVRRVPPMLETGAVGSPGLFGFARPVLLLPMGLAEKLSDGELRHVLLHEAAHLARRDVAFHWLAALARSLHWFNPLAWMVLRRVEEDVEIACDARALAAAAPGEARPYGRTILRLLEASHSATPTPALVGILQERRQVARRMRALVEPAPARGKRWLAAVVFFSLAAGGLSSPRPDPATAPATPAAANPPRDAEPGPALYTRSYKLNTNMLAALLPPAKPFADPFAPAPNDEKAQSEAAQARLRDVLRGQGLDFDATPNGPTQRDKALFLNDRTGMLFVRATLPELDKVEQLLQQWNTPAAFAPDEKPLLFDMRIYEMPGGLEVLGFLPAPPGAVNPAGTPDPFQQPTSKTPPADGLFPGAATPEATSPKPAAPALGTISGILTDPQFRQVVEALANQPGSKPLYLPKPRMTGVLSAEQARVVTRALEGNSKVSLVSRPRVSTKAGVPASLQIGAPGAATLQVALHPERRADGGLDLRAGFAVPIAGDADGRLLSGETVAPVTLSQTVVLVSETVAGRAAMVMISVAAAAEEP